MKAIRPWLLRNLKFSWLGVTRAPTLGLDEGGFGPQFITSLVNEKST